MKESILNKSTAIHPKENVHIEESIQRIHHMEELFDILLNAVSKDSSAIDKDETLKEHLKSLTAYYDSKLWLQDYTLDEQGFLPASLKRGVLSEDGIYNFLTEVKRSENSSHSEFTNVSL